MTGDKRRETDEPLAQLRLGQSGLHVKLDKGFEQGIYSVDVEFGELAERIGFAAARRSARDYCGHLKTELQRLPEYAFGRTEDHSRIGNPHRKYDLETALLSFPMKTSDGRFHDHAIREQFQVACLRTAQAREQAQAHLKTHRRHSRQEKFREQLDRLLQGEAYAGIAPAVRERLLAEVPALVFPARELEP